MTSPHPDSPQFDEHFQANFAAIAPLILEEWVQVSAEQLAATQGNFQAVVDCIATITEHTHVLTRRQLHELYQIALDQHLKPKSFQVTERLIQFANQKLTESQLKTTVEHLESQTETLLQQLKQDLLPELNQKVQKHPVGSLLTAVGVGFVLGLLLGGRRGR